jgi:hypothetical protein
MRPLKSRPEAELLTQVSQVQRDPEQTNHIRALARRDLDWSFVVETARRHWIRPLLFWHLNAICPDAVPGAVLGELRDHFRRNTVSNLLLLGELLTLRQLLETHGIPFLPFKGITLSACAYGNIAMREAGDIDVLLPRRHILKARDLLLAHGYRPILDYQPVQEAAYLKSICQLPFEHKKNGLMVELHAAITPRDFFFPMDFERLWPRRATMSLSGQELPTLSPEDLLLVLCVHGSKHIWSCLRWICDVAALIGAHPKMNWEMVLQEAHRTGSRRMLFLGLLLASDLLRAPLPEHIRRTIHTDGAAKSLALTVSNDLFRPGLPGGFERAWFQFRMRERRRDGVRYCISMALVPTPADWGYPRLPPSIHSLYYLLRPIRLAGKYGQGFLSYFSV